MEKNWVWSGQVKDDEPGNIKQAKLSAKLAEPKDETVLDNDFDYKFGNALVDTLNWFRQHLIENNAKEGTLKIGNMKRFGNISMSVKLEFPE